jgi:hypothetical protein
MRTELRRGCGRTRGIQELGPGEEDDAGAGQRKRPPEPAGNGLEVVPSAFDGAEGDGVRHDPRLEARLDHEQPPDFLQHRHR